MMCEMLESRDLAAALHSHLCVCGGTGEPSARVTNTLNTAPAREKDRERERHTHTHTERERERERDTHTHTHTHTERQTQRERERESERERHTHTHTHTQRDRHTHTHTHTHTISHRSAVLQLNQLSIMSQMLHFNTTCNQSIKQNRKDISVPSLYHVTVSVCVTHRSS